VNDKLLFVGDRNLFQQGHLVSENVIKGWGVYIEVFPVLFLSKTTFNVAP